MRTRTGASIERRSATWLVAIVVSLFALAVIGLSVTGNRTGDAPFPHASLSPADVVRIQVDALARNEELAQDGGIDIAYRFASPANRAVTGPIERFRSVVRAPSYRLMLDHRRAEFGEPVIQGDRAIQRVTIVGAEGETVGFVFELTRQARGRLAGCWLTDAVFPLDDELGAGPRIAI